MRSGDLHGRGELLNKVVIFCFLCAQKYSRSFIKLRLNHWCHMDNFNNVLTTFLGFERGSTVSVQSGPVHTETLFSCIWLNFVSHRHFVQTDLAFWESETDIFFKPGPRVDKSENYGLAFSCVLRIRIFSETMMSSPRVSPLVRHRYVT